MECARPATVARIFFGLTDLDIEVQYVLALAEVQVKRDRRRIDGVGLDEDHINAALRRVQLYYYNLC